MAEISETQLDSVERRERQRLGVPSRVSESLPRPKFPAFDASVQAAAQANLQAQREREQQQAARDAAQWRDAAWRQAGVSARHVSALGERRDAAWRQAFDSLVADMGKGVLVVLLGGRGTGKTQMAVDMIRHSIDVMQAKPAARYVRAMDVFIALKDGYRSGLSEGDIIHDFTRPSLLVIDEAHERSESAWENRVLTHIVDVRYGEMRDTVLIANSKPEDLDSALGPSIVSRLNETGAVIVCDWPSFRSGK